jgi:hypothetical protein
MAKNEGQMGSGYIQVKVSHPAVRDDNPLRVLSLESGCQASVRFFKEATKPLREILKGHGVHRNPRSRVKRAFLEGNCESSHPMFGAQL